VVSCRAKAKSFTPSSILFRPHQMPPYASWRCARRHVVEAPGTAPGSDRLITTAFIAIAGKTGTLNIVVNCLEKKHLELAVRGAVKNLLPVGRGRTFKVSPGPIPDGRIGPTSNAGCMGEKRGPRRKAEKRDSERFIG